ncbi:glycosyltransferase [Pedobacter lithocola]|uniref:Glycosyltransferase n=1 Tax=Pedobacter lithocola TaxID=1908239 RepID=A0ABV8P8N0_9SPHI
MEGIDFVIVGQQPWDTEIGSNCKNIAIEISKTNRVLYINSPLDRITLYRDKNNPKTKLRLDIIEGKANGLIQVQNNLWNLYPDCMVESINWIPSTAIFNLINYFNNKKLSKSILKATKKLGFNNFILFNDNEIFKGYFLNNFLKPKASVYYSRDYMIAVDYWKKHGEQLEPKLIAKNTLCVANSTFLADYCRKYNSNSYYIGQGCDLDIFFRKDSQLEILGLTNIKKPIIGYVGALQSIRLDINIIAHIALTKPEWTIVLVGHEDDIFKGSDLHKYKNIIFTGNKPINLLPDFINAFDVCINPQLINMVTIGNYPRKIDEYLAVGKPVVATATKAMETFSDFVYLAENKEQYISLIEQALSEDKEEFQINRRNFALKHTWENSVKDLYTAIEHTLSDKN